jgi:hypothetical protein
MVVLVLVMIQQVPVAVVMPLVCLARTVMLDLASFGLVSIVLSWRGLV